MNPFLKFNARQVCFYSDVKDNNFFKIVLRLLSEKKKSHYREYIKIGHIWFRPFYNC